MAVGARPGVVVDGRRRQVHQQHGERHAIGIAAPGADDVGEDADAEAEDQPPAIAGGAGHRVGDDEEGAEHGRPAEQMEQWRAMGIGAGTIPEQQAHGEQAGEHAQRRVPGEQPAPEQEQAAEEERQVDPLAAGATEVAEGRVAGEQLVDGQAAVGLQHVEGGGVGPGVRPGSETEEFAEAVGQAEGAVRRGPAGHFQGKRDQRHDVAEHRRVERVLSEAAVQVLAEYQGEEGRHQGQPPGGVGRQGDGQQQGGDQRAAVLEEHPRRTFAQGQHGGFAGQRDEAGPGQVEQGARAVQPGQRQQAGDAGAEHQAHDRRGTVGAAGVGRGGAGQGHGHSVPCSVRARSAALRRARAAASAAASAFARRSSFFRAARA